LPAVNLNPFTTGGRNAKAVADIIVCLVSDGAAPVSGAVVPACGA
jgi:hypothetical protein